MMCCNDGQHKPRVHTGFYNNFLVTVKHIQQYILPLLEDGKPRKLYVVGHSLGAGIATLATCYFLLEHDWNTKFAHHELVSVTAGSPRTSMSSMKATRSGAMPTRPATTLTQRGSVSPAYRGTA